MHWLGHVLRHPDRHLVSCMHACSEALLSVDADQQRGTTMTRIGRPPALMPANTSNGDPSVDTVSFSHILLVCLQHDSVCLQHDSDC